MQQKIFRNIQPNDEFQVVKTGEYFKVIERSTYYCGDIKQRKMEFFT